MIPSTLSTLALALAAVVSAESQPPSKSPLIVNEAPNHVRPYVLPKFKGRAVHLTPSQIIWFSITANSSGGAFSLLQHTGKSSGWTPARPHVHLDTHEHFFCARGRAQIWGQVNTTGADHEARVTTVGDYGNMPPGAIHTFQLVDPDSLLTHIFHPAGFEHLFEEISLGEYKTSVGGPFPANPEDADPYPNPLTPEFKKKMETFDLYIIGNETFIPRRDFINGTAGDNEETKWHNGPNPLPEDSSKPYFIAKDYGPKYINAENGYKVIQPLFQPSKPASPGKADDFTTGTITLSPKLGNETLSHAKLPHPFALQMIDGQLGLEVRGYPPAYLLEGDVAFIPANTPFSYHATVPFTKFLYLNGGNRGLDYQLLEESQSWGLATYPQFAGQL